MPIVLVSWKRVLREENSARRSRRARHVLHLPNGCHAHAAELTPQTPRARTGPSQSGSGAFYRRPAEPTTDSLGFPTGIRSSVAPSSNHQKLFRQSLMRVGCVCAPEGASDQNRKSRRDTCVSLTLEMHGFTSNSFGIGCLRLIRSSAPILSKIARLPSGQCKPMLPGPLMTKFEHLHMVGGEVCQA